MWQARASRRWESSDRDAATEKLTLACQAPHGPERDFGVLGTLSVSPDSQSLYVGFSEASRASMRRPSPS